MITDDPSAAADAFSWEVVDNTPSSNGDAKSSIPWILSGPNPEAIAKAKALVETALSEANKPSATGYLTLLDPAVERSTVFVNRQVARSKSPRHRVELVMVRKRSKLLVRKMG